MSDKTAPTTEGPDPPKPPFGAHSGEAPARLEWELAKLVEPSRAPEDPGFQTGLRQQVQAILTQAESAGRAGRALEAVRLAEDALRTDPSIIPEENVVVRSNILNSLERDRRRVEAVLRLSQERLPSLLTGNRERQPRG